MEPLIEVDSGESTARATAPPMGREAAGGIAWILVTTVCSKAMSFGAQIILGWLLAKRDFGVYAIAISVAWLVQIVREGGLITLLLQRPTEFNRLRGAVFWLALCVNLAICGILFGIAGVVARAYNEPALVNVLRILAIATPLSTPGLIYLSNLTLSLRFGTASRINIASSWLRSLSTVGFAVLGFGPLSFVFPTLLTAIFEGVAGYLATGEKLWEGAPAISSWPSLLSSTKWIMVGGFSILLMYSGDYLVIGRMTNSTTTGIYYFAYQLGFQAIFLLAGNLQFVLLPVFSRMQGDPQRQAAAFNRCVTAIAMLMWPVSLGLAATIKPLELLIWHGRWAAAVPVVAILCVTLPFRLVTIAAKPVYEAAGSYRTYFLICLVDGLSNMAAAGIGSYLGGTVRIAIVIAAYSAFSGLWQGYAVARKLRTPLLGMFRGQLPAFIVALVSAGVAMIGANALPIGGRPILDLGIRGVLFGVTYLAVSAFIFPEMLIHLRESAMAVFRRQPAVQ